MEKGKEQAMAPLDKTVLHIENLGLRFHTPKGIIPAVENFSISLQRGKIHALVGESGSGKSVTVKSVLRLNPQGNTEYTTGSIFYYPAPTHQGTSQEPINLLTVNESVLQSVRGRKISMIFQEPGRYLNPVMRVRQLLAETMITHLRITKREALEKARHLLDLVELPDTERVLASYPHELSGGMKQRVMIAIALSCSPDIILADEPTTALDVTVQAKILNLLKKISRDFNIAVLLITHDLAVVHESADYVSVMYAGRLMESAEVSPLFKSPQHPYTKVLLGAVPDVSRRGQPLLSIPGNIPDSTDRPEGCLFHPRCPMAIEACRMAVPKFESLYQDSHGVACLRARELNNHA
ncbi:MAG: ABC transporter ATP-binding protein [Sphaerochaetaceae bacterium]